MAVPVHPGGVAVHAGIKAVDLGLHAVQSGILTRVDRGLLDLYDPLAQGEQICAISGAEVAVDAGLDSVDGAHPRRTGLLVGTVCCSSVS